MPRLIDYNTEINASASTVQSVYPTDHADGDLDLLWVARDVTGTPHYTTPSGWVSGGISDKNPASVLQWDLFWRFFATGDSAPNITAGVSANQTATIQTVRGVPKHEMTITAVTKANPAVVTYTGSDPTNGWSVGIHSVGGMIELNGNLYTVANVNTGAKTFELSGINSTAYTTYTSGGKAVRNPISGIAEDTAGTGVEDFPALTTTENGCLIVYFAIINNATNASRPIFLEPGACFPVTGVRGSDIEIAWTTTHQKTAGAVPAPRCEFQTAQQKGLFTVAIRDDGTGAYREPCIPVDTTQLFLLGIRPDEPTNQSEIAGTWTDPTSDFATILGVTNYYYNANTQGQNWTSTGLFNQAGIWGESNAEGMSSLTSGAGWASFRFTPTTAINLTGKQIALHLGSNNALGGDYLMPDGVVVIFQSSATNWKAFQVKKAWFAEAIAGYIFDPDYTSPVASNGTLDRTAITGITVAHYVDSSTSTYRVFGLFYVLGKASICGGGSSSPVAPSDIARMLKWRPADTASGQGTSQLLLRQSIEIGNSGTQSYVDLSNKCVELAASNAAKGNLLSSNALTICLNNRTGDVLDAKSTLFTSASPWTFEVNSSTTGTNDFTGATFSNAGAFTFDSNPTWNNITLIDVGTISLGDASLSNIGITVSGCTRADYVFNLTGANQAAIQAELDKLAGWTFDNVDTPTAIIRITFAGSLSLDASGIVFNANCASAHVEYTGTGTLTWTNSDGSNASTEVSTSGTVSFVNPGTGIEFTGLVAGSQVVVCETGTQTELYRDNNSATSEDWDTTGDQGTVDYTIMKAGYIPIRATGVVVGLNKLSVGIEQTFDPVYAASSGLTHTTDSSYNTSTKKLTLTKATTIRNLYSAWIEFWIAESAYVNKPFPLQAYGFNTVAFIDDAEFTADSHGETYVTRGGWRYVQTDGDISAQWAGILSIGTATGFTGEYQQVAGSTVTNARASGVWDQAIKVYGDATHGNFDYRGHLVLKYQPDGYRPSEVDVYGTYGTLFDTLYVVAMEPALIDGLATGDPAPTGLSITNHGASPVTWNSKQFSITITDSGSNTGATILQWLRYNCSLDATFQSQDPFNWPEMVVEDGTKYKTERGTLWGSAGATLKGVRVIDGSGNPHVSFSTMMADDGTVYTVPTTAGIQAANLTAGWAELYNVTQATLIESVATTSGYLYTWVDGTDADAGDVLRLRWRGLGKEPIQASIVATADTTVQVLDSPVTDAVYDSIAINGSTVTEFALDSGNVQFDLDDPDNVWYVGRMYAWYSYAMVSADGIANFWGAVTAVDASNIRINNTVVDVNLDNLSATSCRQGDTIVLYRADGAYPQISTTTGGGGIGMYYAGRGYTVETGVSGLTTEESESLSNIGSVKTKTDQLVFGVTNTLNVNVTHMNESAVAGTGTSGDLWRGA